MASSNVKSPVNSIAIKHGIPIQSQTEDFEDWIHEIEIWQLVTTIEKAKQGPLVYLSLQGKARKACQALSIEELGAEDGLAKLVAKLKELYSADKDQQMFTAYKKFETCKRSNEQSIVDYINEFDRLYNKLISFHMELPTCVLAYQLLKNANLSEEKRQLTRATKSAVTYNEMKKQIKAIHKFTSSAHHTSTPIKVEPTYVTEESNVLFSRGRGYYRGNMCGNYNRKRGGNFGGTSSKARTQNSVDSFGNPIRCHGCNSSFHWINECPYNQERRKGSKEVYIQLFAQEIHDCYIEQFVGETLNSAVLDSGCITTVCGENWLKCYMDTLPDKDMVSSVSSNSKFKFGDGNIVNSNGKVNLPVKIGDLILI